jgi:NAD(P)-dependent dehydrogenase (short-subunit alcohol dehydrogenase family)
VTEDEFDKVFNVNVKSIYHATHIIVPYQQEKKTGGVWINVASTAGSRPRPGLTWYSASKAAVIIATKSLAVDYAKDNIRFNSVSPAVGLATAL